MEFKEMNEKRNDGIYIFYRDDMFYPLFLEGIEDAIANAECNEGTTKVEDIYGNNIWVKK